MAFRMILVALAVIAFQAAARTDAAPTPPYEGQVTGTNVYVRSGPGDYACAKLSSPARVRVVARVYHWLKIAPPAGCYSLVAKQFVSVGAGGAVGTIKGTNINVRAGSDLHPTRAGTIQTRLNTGDKVAILGERTAKIAGKNTACYRIEPPAGVVLWISAKYVKPAAAVPTPPPPADTTRRADTQPTTRAAADKPPVVTTTQPAEQVSLEVAALRAAEKALEAENAKPREERNLAAVLALYQAIPLTPGSPLEPLIKAQIKSLKTQLDLNDDLKEVTELLAEVAARQERLKLAARDTDIKLSTTRPVRASAEGVLDRSNLYRGGPLGKRYVIRTADPGRITYVQCTTGLVELDRHLGARVRVLGVSRFDGKLPAHVIEVEEVNVVTPAPPRPVTTQPTLTLRPEPAPKPKPRAKPAPRPKAKPKPKAKARAEPAPKPKDQAGSDVKPRAPLTKATGRPHNYVLPAGLPIIETVTPEAGVDAEDYE